MYRESFVGAAALALLFSAPAYAHHPSGVSSTGGAGPINTVSATTLEQGQSAAAIFFEIVRMNPFSDAELTAPGTHHPHSLDAILAPSLSYAYGLTKDLTVSARLPYLQRTDVREGHVHGGVPLVEDLGNSSGIGDLTLLGQYRFFNNRASRFEAALLLGVKAPTGKTDNVTDTGERFETEFQPGSGSWDGLFGVAVTQRFGAWSFDSNVLYVLATKGAQQTDLGDRFQYNAAISYRVGSLGRGGPMHLGAMPEPMYHGGPGSHGKTAKAHTHDEPAPRGPTLDLVLELNGEWHDNQTVAGAKDANSGGHTLYLSPGVRVSSGSMSAFASVGIPLVNEMNGYQVEADWRLVTGVSVGF
jgi:Putative MetA-pathway of phenol degradation